MRLTYIQNYYGDSEGIIVYIHEKIGVMLKLYALSPITLGQLTCTAGAMEWK